MKRKKVDKKNVNENNLNKKKEKKIRGEEEANKDAFPLQI